MSAKRSSNASSKADPVFHHRDIVLGKLRGYPPWPGMVADPDSVPGPVARERPKGTKIYCVQFFPAGDYAWLPPKELSKLSVSQIKTYIDEPSKKSGELLQGYKICLDPSKWEEERRANMQEELAGDDDEEDQVADDDDEEDDAGASSSKAGKKRKRASDVGNKKKGGKKEKDAPVSKGTKRGKNNAKSKATVESEDEGDEGAAKKPPIKKARKEREEDDIDAALAEDPEAQKVREWRHKLQKTFLGRTPPKSEDMPNADDLFRTVEQYEQMEIKYLQFSKIGKVMRHIANLADGFIPRDDEFHFRERAQKLVDKWAVRTGSGSGAEGKKTNGTEDAVKGEANGAAEGEKGGDKADGEGEKEKEAKVNGDAEGAENGTLAGDMTMTDIGDLSVMPDASMSVSEA